MAAERPESIPDFVSLWKEAVERGDAAAATDCLSEDVELISPLTARFRFYGHRQLNDVMDAAFETISGIRFHTDVGDADARALFYTGRVGDIDFEEAQLLRLDPEGRIREITLFGRPLPGLTAVMAGMGPRLLRRQGKASLAPVVAAAIAPLTFLTNLGERRLVPLGDPNRNRHRSDDESAS
ncbi:MAG TPA: hypothetical protein VGG43_11465 [Acidimicrobiales bacterium]